MYSNSAANSMTTVPDVYFEAEPLEVAKSQPLGPDFDGRLARTSPKGCLADQRRYIRLPTGQAGQPAGTVGQDTRQGRGQPPALEIQGQGGIWYTGSYFGYGARVLD